MQLFRLLQYGCRWKRNIGPACMCVSVCLICVRGKQEPKMPKIIISKYAPFVIRFDAFDLNESTIENSKKVKWNQNQEDSNSSISSRNNNNNIWNADWKKIPLARIGMCACFDEIGLFSLSYLIECKSTMHSAYIWCHRMEKKYHALQQNVTYWNFGKSLMNESEREIDRDELKKEEI